MAMQVSQAFETWTCYVTCRAGQGRVINQPSLITKIAVLILQHGAAILPAFAFGQTDMYSWAKMGALESRLNPGVSAVMGGLPLRTIRTSLR